MEAALVIGGLFMGAGIAMWKACEDGTLQEVGMAMTILGGIGLAVLLF